MNSYCHHLLNGRKTAVRRKVSHNYNTAKSQYTCTLQFILQIIHTNLPQHNTYICSNVYWMELFLADFSLVKCCSFAQSILLFLPTKLFCYVVFCHIRSIVCINIHQCYMLYSQVLWLIQLLLYHPNDSTSFVQVFCGITIAMGIIMAIWDCNHLIVTSSTNSRLQQVVTLVPVNSTQPEHVTTAV